MADGSTLKDATKGEVMHNKQSVNLQLVLCPTREPDPEYKHLYHKIYTCWSKVWAEAYNEINYKKRSDDLKSDAFTRQDFATAIFHEDNCVAVILYRYVDMSLQTAQDDSFFSQWSELHRKSLSKVGKRFIVAANLAVPPEFRKKNFGFSFKELAVGLIAELALQSNADAAIATPRRDRNVHGTCYAWGATPIAQDIPWGSGIQIDLVAFCKEHVAQHRDHSLMPLLDELWQNKIVVGENIFESIDHLKNTLPYNLQNKNLNKKTG